MADSVMDSSSGQDVSWLSTTTTSSDLISETSGDVESSDLEQNVQGAERKGELDDIMIVSGWGDLEDYEEEMDKNLAHLLSKWDGKNTVILSKISKICRKGIPPGARCQVWQILSGAINDTKRLEAYAQLLTKDSIAMDTIHRDVERTFLAHSYFREQSTKTALYNICKAYSIYDADVGYYQGLSFVAAMLLSQMNEEFAFAVLVQIMQSFGHRDLFLDDFSGLYLLFFQLEKLVQENLPDLYTHFLKNKIAAHMYATDWFLTLYSSKFPLCIVYRLMDVYLSERSGSVVLLFALALLQFARQDLLMRDFEGILSYFSEVLPKKFQTLSDCQLLFHTMFNFKVTNKELIKFKKDYEFSMKKKKDVTIKVEENTYVRDTIKCLEAQNTILAQDVETIKVQLNSNIELEHKVNKLLEARGEDQSNIEDLREELHKTKEVFQHILETFMKDNPSDSEDVDNSKIDPSVGIKEDVISPTTPEEQIQILELELKQTKLALAESCSTNMKLENRLDELSSDKKHWWSLKKKK